jgi:putative OPT family oligopeptide transporter
MEHTSSERPKLLPENAYRKLEPGEEYKPIVLASDLRAEVSPWSVFMGLVMVLVFSMACVYMALRAGNAIEASIPIAILAIFFGRLRKKPSTILENVMVQSIGQAAGVVAAGSTFVIPALYINRHVYEAPIDVYWWQIFLACMVGGFLGVVLIIPLRKYFVKDLHGELPFPEATAINEILVTGESSAGGAGKILLLAFAVGALFDFSIESFHLWNAELDSTHLLGSFGKTLGDLRIEVQLAGLAALFGLGYIIGVKYASIIASGSVLAFMVMVPVVYLFGRDAEMLYVGSQGYNVADMSAYGIFKFFIKPVGIGAIAVSGIIGILRMGKIVVSSITLGFKGFSKDAVKTTDDERTQRDMNPKTVLLIQLGSILAMGLLFFVVAKTTADENGQTYTMGASLTFAVVGMLVGFLLSFLFTPVAAQAIAIVGVNPVSGMTLITVVMAIGALLLFGLKGMAGMIIALIVGTAVCTALSTSGALISDFKIGYWIGSTPANQEKWKYLGVILASLVVAFVIPLMDQAYHFAIQDPATGQWVANAKVLPAPQANMMADLSRGLLNDAAGMPWLLYGLGGLVAILLFMAGVPMLAFALGMYLPISINMAILAGAICAWVIGKTGKKDKVKKARAEQGTLIASGLMAGAAIFGILTAVFRLPALGAPIRHLSVGAHYYMAPVVEGQIVWETEHEGKTIKVEVDDDGKISSMPTCEQIKLKEGQACDPNLFAQEYVRDKSGKIILKKHKITESKGYELDEQEQKALEDDQLKAFKLYGPRNYQAAEVDGKVIWQGEEGTGPRIDSKGRITVMPGCAVEPDKCKKKLQQYTRNPQGKIVLVDKREAEEITSQGYELNGEELWQIKKGFYKAPHLVPWYHETTGKMVGFIMLLVLCLACYLLARLGANWALAGRKEEDAEEAEA